MNGDRHRFDPRGLLLREAVRQRVSHTFRHCALHSLMLSFWRSQNLRTSPLFVLRRCSFFRQLCRRTRRNVPAAVHRLTPESHIRLHPGNIVFAGQRGSIISALRDLMNDLLSKVAASARGLRRTCVTSGQRRVNIEVPLGTHNGACNLRNLHDFQLDKLPPFHIPSNPQRTMRQSHPGSTQTHGQLPCQTLPTKDKWLKYVFARNRSPETLSISAPPFAQLTSSGVYSFRFGPHPASWERHWRSS